MTRVDARLCKRLCKWVCKVKPMGSEEVDLSTWAEAIQAYSQWLVNESNDAAKMWSQKLNSQDRAGVEAAAAEAITWDYLTPRLGTPSLADDPSVGGPDFCFETPAGPVYVEVTNLSRDVVTRHTGLPDLPDGGARNYSPLTGLIKNKITQKAGQLGDHGAPMIVVVSTLHFQASVVCIQRKHLESVLHSEPRITWLWNPETGDAVGEPFQQTDFRLGAFTKGRAPVASRTHLSGIVVAGFGLRPPAAHVFGLHHPEAARPIAPEAMGDIPFCRFAEWPPQGEIKLEWTVTEEDEERESREAAEARLRAAGLGDLVDDVRREARARNKEP